MEPFGFLMCGGRQWQQVHHRRRLTGWGAEGLQSQHQETTPATDEGGNAGVLEP